EAQRIAEEEAQKKLVYEDVPVLAGPYVSETAAITDAEVCSLTITPERRLLKISVSRPQKSFGAECKFADRDAREWLATEYMHKIGVKKYMEPAFNTYDPMNPDKKLLDNSCQVAAESVTCSSQTDWNRPANAAVQYCTMHLDEAEKEAENASPAMQLFLLK
ncbi:unnamed protein product, partial [Chrysoparadoxa australica]